MSKITDKCYGQFGWKEFIRNRKNILDEYDKIKELTESRPVKVAHGNAAEAHLRKWLSEFLPKKYAVTSGYIIPDIYQGNYKLYHYDIIIYNQLESPILWTEGNEDQSKEGKFKAIPAKYVHAIYEVKSRFNQKNVKDALVKLEEINEFSSRLASNFKSGLILLSYWSKIITVRLL